MNGIKNKKTVQIVISVLALLSPLFFGFLPIGLFLAALIVFHIVAHYRDSQSLKKVARDIRHWIIEAFQHDWVLFLMIIKHQFTVPALNIPIQGKRYFTESKQFRLGWPLGALAMLIFAGVFINHYRTFTPVTADSPVTGRLPFPIGADRVNMDDDQLIERAGEFVESRRFYLLREDGAVAGAEKVTGPTYAAAIKGASAMYGIDPNILEAHVYLESQGKANAKSPTGPKGPGQFAALTAANMWAVKDGKFLLRYKGQEKDIAKKRRRVKALKPSDIIEDNREDVELSIYGEAKFLREERDFFGRQDFASAAYHSGRGKIREWIKTFLSPKPTTTGGKADVEANNLTFDKLYFGTTPYKNPGTYKKFQELNAEDFGANYWYKIVCAEQLLELYRKNPNAFKELAEKQRFKGKRATNRMWTFYGPDDEASITLDDLKRRIDAEEFVYVPNDAQFGFTLRLEGSDAIAMLDKPNQESYIATKPETAGALLYISKEIQKLRQGRQRLTLEVTSVSRTLEYQKKLTKANPVATKEMSFHVLGLAFDITNKGMSDEDKRDLQFILDELDSIGYISWVPENKAYHIVVAPDKNAIAFFQSVFNSTGTYRLPSPLALFE